MMGHMLQYHSGDPIGSRRFVVWSAAEGFLKYRRGDLADQHWVRRSGVGPDVSEPGKGSAHWECGIWGESFSLQVSEV